MVDLTEQDLLTGLLHASAFSRRVDAALARAIDAVDAVAMVVAELPPMADDGVVIEAARRVRDATRSRDHVARTGTGELAICCPEADEAEARAVARRIAEVLAQPFELDGNYVMLPVGIGMFFRDAAVAGDTAGFMLLAARSTIDRYFP
jgi:GGDEF domain-containing protein